jgi:hypothetical protein
MGHELDVLCTKGMAKQAAESSPSEVGRGFIPGINVVILEAFRP